MFRETGLEEWLKDTIFTIKFPLSKISHQKIVAVHVVRT